MKSLVLAEIGSRRLIFLMQTLYHVNALHSSETTKGLRHRGASSTKIERNGDDEQIALLPRGIRPHSWRSPPPPLRYASTDMRTTPRRIKRPNSSITSSRNQEPERVIRAPRTCMKSLTRSRGAVTVLAMAPEAAPAAKSAALLGTSASRASGCRTSCAAGGSLRSFASPRALPSFASTTVTAPSTTALTTSPPPPSRTESDAKAGSRGPARSSATDGAPWLRGGGRHESHASTRRRPIGGVDLRARGKRGKELSTRGG
jgi:hypothetical protein